MIKYAEKENLINLNINNTKFVTHLSFLIFCYLGGLILLLLSFAIKKYQYKNQIFIKENKLNFYINIYCITYFFFSLIFFLISFLFEREMQYELNAQTHLIENINNFTVFKGCFIKNNILNFPFIQLDLLKFKLQFLDLDTKNHIDLYLYGVEKNNINYELLTQTANNQEYFFLVFNNKKNCIIYNKFKILGVISQNTNCIRYIQFNNFDLNYNNFIYYFTDKNNAYKYDSTSKDIIAIKDDFPIYNNIISFDNLLIQI
jgi:hypothetical protein